MPPTVSITTDIFDAVVAKIVAAQATTLSYVKSVYQGDDDRALTGETPFILIRPTRDPEEWRSFQNRRTCNLAVELHCVCKDTEVPTSLSQVRGALKMKDDICNVLEADMQLANTVEYFNIFTDRWEGIGEKTYGCIIVLQAVKLFQKGART